MRAGFLRQLASWGDLERSELEERIRAAAHEVGIELSPDIEPEQQLVAFATRLARRRLPTRSDKSQADSGVSYRRNRLLAFIAGVAEQEGRATPDLRAEQLAALDLLAEFASLDRRRQRLLLELARELRTARDSGSV